ncbi:MAG TPA: C40 family peptidase [Burkholderiaceae bacterium]|nr:C40 family peptidase [Burkholderiaceae bacterium]HNB45274.1 C40 family peptidase [Burkholderiaceae bacterium]HNG81021.1 C40 family peptidase [Burkholderiaceae bacterium]
MAATLATSMAHAAPTAIEARGPSAGKTEAAPTAVAPEAEAPAGLAALSSGGAVLLDKVRDTTSDLVMSAMNFLGVPYRRGGNSETSGFDCSGFTRYVFENSIGRLLPRRSRDQAASNDLLKISRDDLKPGDLVFFNTMRKAFSHVGIYMGDGKFIHAPHSGSHVRIDDMREAYWTQRFNGARRLPELNNGTGWKMPSLLPSATAAQLSGPASSAHEGETLR